MSTHDWETAHNPHTLGVNSDDDPVWLYITCTRGQQDSMYVVMLNGIILYWLHYHGTLPLHYIEYVYRLLVLHCVLFNSSIHNNNTIKYTSHLFMERTTCVMWECLQSAAQCTYVNTYWSGTTGDLHIQYVLILQWTNDKWRRILISSLNSACCFTIIHAVT